MQGWEKESQGVGRKFPVNVHFQVVHEDPTKILGFPKLLVLRLWAIWAFIHSFLNFFLQPLLLISFSSRLPTPTYTQKSRIFTNLMKYPLTKFCCD